MYKHFILFTLLIAVCSLAAWASVSPQKGRDKVNVSKPKEKVDKARDSEGCKSPRPKNRGCSIACKPCLIPVCENGQWKYERVDWPKEQCEPRPGGGGGKVCNIGISDPCPAECKKCVRQ